MGSLRSCAVAALVLVLASGCSAGSSPDRVGAGGRAPGSGQTQPNGGTQPNSTGGPGGASGTATPGGTGPNATNTIPGDYISSFANDDGSWGCAMKPGQFCRVRVQGAYFLRASNAGAIQIVAFENGSSTPAEESVLKTVPGGGTQYNAVFGYRIGRDARTFAIQAYLKDDRGVIVARSRPQSFPVNR